MFSRQTSIRPNARNNLDDFFALALEPADSLEADLRDRLGCQLQADFHSVALHRSPFADALCRRMRARGFAFGDHIAIRRDEGDLTSPVCQSLLVHELAHVLQQRLGRGRPSGAGTVAAAVEGEAEAAVSAVLAGQEFRCKVADSAGVPRAWDLAGHYYTTYLAGCDEEEAKSLATCCWLPDQVMELDAKTIGLNDWGLASPISVPLFDLGEQKDVNVATYKQGYEVLAGRRFRNHKQYVSIIHSGIHCFTGGDGGPESLRRATIFRDMKRTGSLLKLGLALHAFGDSFAHRRDAKSQILYSAGWGHALGGEGVDEPWSSADRGEVYMQYLRALIDLACAYSGKGPIVGADDLVAALSPMLTGLGAADKKGLLSKWSAKPGHLRNDQLRAGQHPKSCDVLRAPPARRDRRDE